MRAYGRAGLESGQQWHRCPISTSSARTAATRSVPYITECPYCGNRLRKRAPKIERDGTVSEPRKARKAPQGRSRARGCRASAPARSPASAASSPRARTRRSRCVVLSLFGYLLLFPVALVDVGGRAAVDGEWWRVATSPFLYASIWYELAAVSAIAVFGWLLERRHGPLVVLGLFVLCGMGGIALAVAVDPTPLAIGGNGAALGLLCAWAVPDLMRAQPRRGVRRRPAGHGGLRRGPAAHARWRSWTRARSPASRAARRVCWPAWCWLAPRIA